MRLRPYQETAIAAVRASWAAGKQRPLLVAPTGAGKTEMGGALLAPFRSPCVIVHTDVLLEQTARRLPRCRVYTIQSLIAGGDAGNRRRAGLIRHDAVAIDEAHHIVSDSWSQVLPHIDGLKCFGLTATPMRADGTPLGDVFDDLIVAAKYSELVAAGHLVRCDVWSPDVSRRTQKANKVRPDGAAAYLEHGKRMVSDGAFTWRAGIHFETTIEACKIAMARYVEAGVRCALVCKDTPSGERRRIFDAYSAGDLDMLLSPTALAEGFDSPRAEVCVLRRSCDHEMDFMQRVGRVLRPCPGKERALLIDCCDTRSKHGLPTDDRVYSLDGRGISAPEPVPEFPEEEEVKMIRLGYEAVQARYTIIRDTLLSRYRGLIQEADELGYANGWAFHRFYEQTGIKMPHAFPAKFRSVCEGCRRRAAIGEGIFWLPGDQYGKSHVYHQECWIRSLDGEKLDTMGEALESGGQ